jgi:hypothetical protein
MTTADRTMPLRARKTVETVNFISVRAGTSLKRGVNEISKMHARRRAPRIDSGFKIKFTHALLALDDKIS